MSNVITISIAANKAGVGSSCVSQAVAQALVALGFKVDLQLTGDHIRSETYQQTCVDGLAQQRCLGSDEIMTRIIVREKPKPHRWVYTYRNMHMSVRSLDAGCHLQQAYAVMDATIPTKSQP